MSEDGRNELTISLANLPLPTKVQLELATAVEKATGPLGVWKRLGSARNIPKYCRSIASWIAASRPGLTTLADLTAADGRMLARSYSERRRLSGARVLLRHCDEVPPEVHHVLAQHLIENANESGLQPYTEAELNRICVAARGLARRARDRIHRHRQLIEDYRAGRFDEFDDRDPQKELAAALEFCDRTDDIPRSPITGAPTTAAGRAVRTAGGISLMRLIHLTTKEAWAFAVLLAALTGINASVLNTLPASHLRASSPNETGVALVRTSKPRRGSSKSEGSQPITAFRMAASFGDELPLASDKPETSLTTPFGVFMLLVELSESGRRQLGTDRAFVYYAGVTNRRTGSKFAEGVPMKAAADRLETWLRPWLTGETVNDSLLSSISLTRLRKTRIERSRTPIGHTRSTHHQYLKQMRKVTEDGFGIVREALEEQVSRAVARRSMRVIAEAPQGKPKAVQDTVLGCCVDIEHSPLDGGVRCQQSFLTCLECANARAFPRHLPVQLLVVEALSDLRSAIPIQQWVDRYAGYVGQLEDIIGHYTAAQVRQARAAITDDHRQVVDHLLSGTFDPP